MDIKRHLLSVTLSAALLFAFVSCANTPLKEYDSGSQKLNRQALNTQEKFFRDWDGESITPEMAEDNWCVMDDGTGRNDYAWTNFLIAANSSEDAEIALCTEGSLTYVSRKKGSDTATIRTKVRAVERIIARVRTVTPVEICCVRNDEEDTLDYYLSDCLLYSVKAKDEDGYRNVPGVFECHTITPQAAVTFPMETKFSSYSDFEEYYDKYHASMGLDDMKEKMEKFNSEGGFNTNVVFLYGDIAGGEAEYKFLRAVEDSGTLTLYLRRSYTTKNNGSFTKWLLTCTVPGEYLSEVSPDNIRWVIYDDEESLDQRY